MSGWCCRQHLGPLFQLVQSLVATDTDELYRTLNMGIGMVAFVPGDDAPSAIAHLASRGLQAWQLGAVRQRHPGEAGDASAKGGAGGAVTLVGDYRA